MKKNIQKGECGMKKYLMGTWVEGWREAKAQNLTFIVTEDCNLRCKYCYVTHKSSNARMTFETAKKFIDYIFCYNKMLNIDNLNLKSSLEREYLQDC